MDYKETLNLPKTDFPMRANLPQNEPLKALQIVTEEFVVLRKAKGTEFVQALAAGDRQDLLLLAIGAEDIAGLQDTGLSPGPPGYSPPRLPCTTAWVQCASSPNARQELCKLAVKQHIM